MHILEHAQAVKRLDMFFDLTEGTKKKEVCANASIKMFSSQMQVQQGESLL